MTKIKEMMNNMFHKKNIGKRTVAVIVANIMMGFALSLLVKVDMGIDPCSSMNLGIAKHLRMSLGNWLVLFNIMLFFVILRYDKTKIGIGTLVNMVVVGYVMDFFSWVWIKTLPINLFDSLSVRIAILIPTLMIFILAASTYIAVDLGTSPYDAVPMIIASRQNKVPFRVVRICWDALATLIGFMLGSTIGIVTVVMAFALGTVITIVQKKIACFI